MSMPAPRDPVETSRILATWLSRQRPGMGEVVVDGLQTPQSNGFSNDTFLFEAEWRGDHGAERRGLVARLEPHGYNVFPEYDLPAQAHIMNILRAEGSVPVPEVLWLENDPAVLGVPFYVMERIDGRIPTDSPPYHTGGWVAEIEPRERERLWWSGLETMASIHRLDWRRLGLDFVARPQLGAAGMAQQLAYCERYFAWAARGKPQPIAEAAFAWIRRNLPQEEHLAFCWGDARIGNMIFRDGRCVAVLDWEMATIGDPEMDLAWWLFLDRHHSEALGVPRLEGFPSVEATVARYEELLQRRMRHLRFYEIFAAFRFAIIMMRIAQMLAVYGLLPADSDMETNNTVTQLLERSLAAVL